MSASVGPGWQAPLPLLDLDVLRNFVAIVENRSFSRAAQQVHRTPSALSMQIKSLEATLGKALLVREARRISTTTEGETLLRYARRLLNLNQEAVTQFLQPALQGSVRMGTADDVGTRLLPQVLSRFARFHPSVQVDVSVAPSLELMERFDGDDLDVALMTSGTDGLPEGRGEVVHSEPLVWAGRSGGLASECRPLQLALSNHGCAWRRMALAALDATDIDYRIAYVSESTSGLCAALSADLAVSALPASMVEAPLRSLGQGVGLPVMGNYQVLMLRHPDRQSASDALAETVIEAFQHWSGQSLELASA
ncbi:LysR substrate-binding domain-containing protein [Halomonas cupida]|uniref:DNA-binding transcriptional regulator, LysR family n=1 Tax=Halomonas cupida TaxID=44933 RepID=A0A1M7JD45_9GAMM|nr:LysR substrate-binding domain-containing protein [Halomonas cupida]GEN26254.1 LysR family transcriptional regulator [Halomonas cupida]SHM50868.1 DNA-binding transcriptional regulator, LysR family [Halomonas cupida]